MTEFHPGNGHRILTESLSKHRPATKAPERDSIERTSECPALPNTSMQEKTEMLAIWGFVVFSFAAFFLCGFILWLKCSGDWAH
jgi:hypothetical protein